MQSNQSTDRPFALRHMNPRLCSPTANLPQLILASASPRRHDLLATLGVPFTVLSADIVECPLANEAPYAYVRRLAKDKARHVAQRFPEAVVLGADTAVVIDQQILGKPAGEQDAKRMLRQLSGRVHQVMTGLAVLQYGRRFCRQASVSTEVKFRPLSASEIGAYIATGEPFDKAGAYAIQGRAAAFVEMLNGSFTNVVGLPLSCTATLLRAAGFPVTPSGHNGKSAS
jgi:septum formation protein